MKSPILMVPNATGSGHNMRALALATELVRIDPTREVVVLLGSMQSTFEQLFVNAGVRVVLARDSSVDHARSGHLSVVFDQEEYIDKYLVPTFFSGSKIIDYLSYFTEISPAIVVSDYNLSASAAANIGGYRNVLVTERYDFSLNQLTNADLRSAGFVLGEEDIDRVRPTLKTIFDWLVRNAQLVLTDKPPIPSLDASTALYAHLNAEHVFVTGPMTRVIPELVDRAQIRKKYGLGEGPLIVASVGGTTMFMENKRAAIQAYCGAFLRIRNKYPDAEMVLIGRGHDALDIPGIHAVDFVTDWFPLLRTATVLIAQPGWITVTEVATMSVPVIYVLGGRSEYHEIETLRRLSLLGFPTAIEPRIEEIASWLEEAIQGKLGNRNKEGLAVLAPTGNRDTVRAAQLIHEVVK